MARKPTNFIMRLSPTDKQMLARLSTPKVPMSEVVRRLIRNEYEKIITEG